ncbi:hypothetical protein DEJ13_01605 [Curtobacterium sp. MCLR17_007]|uniref:hypothetical protein n=1 Tax=unclassified Curtobacterium TaxID=257496 RepID=UPI0006FEA209|nr:MULTISPECIES: hypothetical protein [unclassified Curtobacterium]KQS06055.1 hypothetical protein ASG04_15895 [Curtobacterium sp. Leaf183]WIB60551.1 hypothetical protein DEJ13_01605 [Curtobacterium sp. MCLR17_007]
MTRGTTRTHRTRLLALAGGLAAAFLLAGCTGGAAQPDGSASPTGGTATTPAPTSTAAAGSTPDDGAGSTTPRPTSTTTPAAGADASGTVPATCEGLLTAGRWKFANAPLNDPAVVGSPVAIPKSVFDPVRQSDGKRLYCVWRDPRADITTMAIDVGVVDSSAAVGALRDLPGIDCARDGQGYWCQEVSTDEQYGVQLGTTYFTLGDIGIEIKQANVPTTGLLDDVMAHVF